MYQLAGFVPEMEEKLKERVQQRVQELNFHSFFSW